MARKRNGDSRNAHQKTDDSHDVRPKTGTDQVRDEESEGSRNQEQGTHPGRGRDGRRGRGGRRGRDDRRSMSPERGDVQSGQQANHRDNRRSRTPLPARNLRDIPTETHQVQGRRTTDAMDQVPSKRKLETSEDEGLHANKKAHSGPGEMQSSTVTSGYGKVGVPAIQKNERPDKESPGLTVIKKMTEEERTEMRGARFRPSPVGPIKAIVLKTSSQGPGSPEPRHGVKDDRKTTHATEKKANALTPKSPDRKGEVSSAKQPSPTSKVATTKSLDEPVIRAAAITPKPRPESAETTTQKMENPEISKYKTDGITASPSLASSKPDIPPAKRSKRKLEQVEDSEFPSPKMAKVNHDAIIRRNDRVKKSLDDHHMHADENLFPEEGIAFVDYDVYSIPLLCSRSIEHQYQFEVLNKASDKLKRTFTDESEGEVFGRKMLVLRQEALRLSRKKFWTFEDLGRKKASKVEPTRDIGDCDLYLYNGKVHVATERGLLLAAVYLKLIGVPDTQPVRFHGNKPAWMSRITAKPEQRRVLESWHPTTALKRGGCISITHGSTVVVYEHGVFDIDTKTGSESRMAYGAREEDAVTGWFDYAKTCRIDWLEDPENIVAATHDTTVIDWAKFDYGPLIARATAQQAAQLKPTATAQRTAIRGDLKPPRPPTTEETVSSTSGEVAVASPKALAAPADSKTEQQIAEDVPVSKSSKGSATDAEFSHLCALQKDEEFPLLSVAGGPISRHDSPNSRSGETATEDGSDLVGEDKISQGPIDATLPKQASGVGSAVTKETARDPFSSPRQALPGLDIPEGCQGFSCESAAPVSFAVQPGKTFSKVFQRHEDEVDWDDTDFQENNKDQNTNLNNKEEDGEL